MFYLSYTVLHIDEGIKCRARFIIFRKDTSEQNGEATDLQNQINLLTKHSQDAFLK